MILYDPAFGMPHLGRCNCGCQKIYKKGSSVEGHNICLMEK